MRLNRRFAPTIYEAVVTITGSEHKPCIGGNGTIIEYAVRMREFAQAALASQLLKDDALTGEHVDTLAATIAALHAEAEVATRDSTFGSPEAVIAPARENFTQLINLMPDANQASIVDLRVWSERDLSAQRAQFAARQAAGNVRDCHGDLHLGNIAMLDGRLTPFDCIEFNPALRWIDVMNEVAFLVMDFKDRGRADFASRFLNAYLVASGDYAGLAVLRFYLVYRAMVRAKVHALRAAQQVPDDATYARLIAASNGYIALAQGLAQIKRPAIILMNGMSGSGKSVIARALAEQNDAILVRSDVERKRLSSLAPLARSDSSLSLGVYTADVTRDTYYRLLDLAHTAINAGYRVIVDATFLMSWQRDLFRHQANALNIPFVIVNVTAPESILRGRISARLATGSDASEADQAVLTQQLAQDNALNREEASIALHIDTACTDRETSCREACVALRTLLNTDCA